MSDGCIVTDLINRKVLVKVKEKVTLKEEDYVGRVRVIFYGRTGLLSAIIQEEKKGDLKRALVEGMRVIT